MTVSTFNTKDQSIPQVLQFSSLHFFYSVNCHSIKTGNKPENTIVVTAVVLEVSNVVVIEAVVMRCNGLTLYSSL